MKTRNRDAGERTEEVTGRDATMGQAEIGDAGNGADPYGADVLGGLPEIEEEARPSDILPDQLRPFPATKPPTTRGDREVTARSSERPPIDPSELP